MASIERSLANSKNITEYLREHYQRLGLEKYRQSLVALEHGVGTGFGRVGNTGSNDCLKEQIRQVGTSLGAKFSHIDQIYFKTERGLSITQNSRTKKNFRTEHTLELADDLYPEYEKQFIFSSKSSSPKEMLDWIVSNHICVGIHPEEEKTKRQYGNDAVAYKQQDFRYPFKKYSALVYYRGKNVTDLTREQIAKINQLEHNDLEINWDKYQIDVDQTRTKLFERVNSVQSHLLCSQDIAEQYYNDPNALFYYHYQYKLLKKVGNPASVWYNAQVVREFRRWEKKKGLQPI